MSGTARLQALADFLRTRRARLTPADVGLPAGARRRAPGLRREEVALLAGVSTSWYTALEQERDIRPSEQVVESLAQALKLTADERRHLFLLTQQHASPSSKPHEEQVSPGMRQVVENLDPNPAYLMGRRWDLLVWNRAAALLYDFDAPLQLHSRNLLWRMLVNPEVRRRNPDWESVARYTVAQFRADYARYPGDPWFTELIDDLREACPEFDGWWTQHDVYGTPDCHKRMSHPTLGVLEFERLMLHPSTVPDLKLVIYSATPATAALLKQRVEASAVAS